MSWSELLEEVAGVVIYFGVAATLGFGPSIGAVIGALVATALLYILGAGRVSATRLILVGVG